MCRCEEQIALRLLPHQVVRAYDPVSGKEVNIAGFGESICDECRGVPPQAYPKSEASRVKGKVARFYWREIAKTYYADVAEWLESSDQKVDDILEFEASFPKHAKQLRSHALEHWQHVHRTQPKYSTSEPTITDLFDQDIPERIFAAEYVKVEIEGTAVGKWLSSTNEPVSAEAIAEERFREQDYSVIRCERRLITSWVGVFLCHAIQRGDDRLITGYRRSTIGWAPNSPETPMVEVKIPADFGSASYYLRRKNALEDWIAGVGAAANLGVLFDALIEDSLSLRDYLWVADDQTIRDARTALGFLPASTVARMIRWVIQDFWARQSGWPDFLVYGRDSYFFSEVKSPNDKLSLEQRRWFEWALNDGFPTEICRVRKLRNV